MYIRKTFLLYCRHRTWSGCKTMLRNTGKACLGPPSLKSRGKAKRASRIFVFANVLFIFDTTKLFVHSFTLNLFILPQFCLYHS